MTGMRSSSMDRVLGSVLTAGSWAVLSLWVLYPAGALAQNCMPDTIVILSQAEADSFQNDHGPCDTVIDDLTIAGDDILFLSGLSGLRVVGGDLTISRNPQLQVLGDLNGVVKVGGYLNISENESLVNLSGLGSLTQILGFVLVSSNPALPDLDGLEGLQQIVSDLEISENTSLENINGLGNLKSVGGIAVEQNPLLGDLNGLAGITGFDGILSIVNNDSLIDLRGLAGIDRVSRLWVHSNDALKSLEGLNSLSQVSWDIVIDRNESLQGLKALASIKGANSIAVMWNSSLESLDGLAGISTLNGSLKVLSNPKVTTLDGLSSLSHVGDDLSIGGNDSLSNVLGLSSLQTVGDILSVLENASLYSLNGLSTVREVGTLAVRTNRMLDDCRALAGLVDPIDHFQMGPGTGKVPDVAESVNIDSNLPGCNSVAEILGSVPLLRVNAGLTDAWYGPETAGQGFFVVVFPHIEQMFLAWFTYDVERPTEVATAILGEPGHRWLTAQGRYTENVAELELYVTTGGVFDSGEPAPDTRPYGELTLEFKACNSAVVTYEIPSIGRREIVPIERVSLDNVSLCYLLDNEAQLSVSSKR